LVNTVVDIRCLYTCNYTHLKE